MIQSTMQRLVETNANLRRTGKIDRVVCWGCINAVVWVQALKLLGVM